MIVRIVLLSLIGAAIAGPAAAQAPVTYRSAVVALTDDPQLRERFESTLVTLARSRNYDAVTSYDIEPDITNLDRRRFMRTLADHGVQAVLMLRPAAIGAGSSLEAVRNEVSADVYENMREFAQAVSSSRGEDLIAVVHMGIYVLDGDDAHMISSGAVWLDEQVDDQAQGIERLQNLIAANIDAARPAIRRRLGLPPLR